MSLLSGLLQGTVGEVLSNVKAAQEVLDTNTTLIIETVSRATSHMSEKGGGGRIAMWFVNACVGSVIQLEGGTDTGSHFQESFVRF